MRARTSASFDDSSLYQWHYYHFHVPVDSLAIAASQDDASCPRSCPSVDRATARRQQQQRQDKYYASGLHTATTTTITTRAPCAPLGYMPGGQAGRHVAIGVGFMMTWTKRHWCGDSFLPCRSQKRRRRKRKQTLPPPPPLQQQHLLLLLFLLGAMMV